MNSPETLTSRISADEALQRLIDGNQRFLRGEARFHDAEGHPPHLAQGSGTVRHDPRRCSDSRVPPAHLRRGSAPCLSYVSPATSCRPRSAAASNTPASTCARRSSWCSGTRVVAPCRRRWMRNGTECSTTIAYPDVGRRHPSGAPRGRSACAPPALQLTRAVEANVRLVDASDPRDAGRPGADGRRAHRTRRRHFRHRFGARALSVMIRRRE